VARRSRQGSAPLPPLPPPTLVNLESSLGCNLSCVMCAAHLTGITRTHRVMSDELLARVEAEVLPGAHQLALTVAAEPFASPSLRDFVALAKRHGVRLQLTTNATLIRDDALLRDVLAQSGAIHFSVDGATPAVFEAIRVGARFEHVLENIRRVVKARRELPTDQRPDLAMSVVLMRRNIHQLPDLVDLCADLGLDAIGMAHLTVMTPELDGESLRHDPDLAERWIAAARHRADARRVVFTAPPRMDGTPQPISLSARRTWLRRERATWRGAGGHRKLRALTHRLRLRLWSWRAEGRVPCHYLQARTFISIGGDVTPCCMPGRPVAGNLREQSFAEIWNGPVLTSMREGFLRGEPWTCCDHCSVNPRGHVPADEQTTRPPSVQLPSGGLRAETPPRRGDSESGYSQGGGSKSW